MGNAATGAAGAAQNGSRPIGSLSQADVLWHWLSLLQDCVRNLPRLELSRPGCTGPVMECTAGCRFIVQSLTPPAWCWLRRTVTGPQGLLHSVAVLQSCSTKALGTLERRRGRMAPLGAALGQACGQARQMKQMVLRKTKWRDSRARTALVWCNSRTSCPAAAGVECSAPRRTDAPRRHRHAAPPPRRARRHEGTPAALHPDRAPHHCWSSWGGRGLRKRKQRPQRRPTALFAVSGSTKRVWQLIRGP